MSGTGSGLTATGSVNRTCEKDDPHGDRHSKGDPRPICTRPSRSPCRQNVDNHANEIVRVHTRRRQEDMIEQHFDPPHPIRPLQAAIHIVGRSTATTLPPATPRRNVPPQSILIIVHPVVPQLIDFVEQVLR